MLCLQNMLNWSIAIVTEHLMQVDSCIMTCAEAQMVQTDDLAGPHQHEPIVHAKGVPV